MHKILVNCLFKLARGKSVVKKTDCPAMTIAVDLGRKTTKQTNELIFIYKMYSLILGQFGYMRGSRKFCKKVSTSDKIYFY